jgi:MraZ protein
VVGFQANFSTIKIMLIGEYKHTLDPKKRLSVPSKWRMDLGTKFIVTRGLDNCLFVYPLLEWQKITDTIGDLSLGTADSRSFNRFFLSGAVEVEVDSVGRILVPDFLKEYAKLDSKVVLAGIHTRVEIWDETKWNESKAKFEQQADSLAERLGAIGVL